MNENELRDAIKAGQQPNGFAGVVWFGKNAVRYKIPKDLAWWYYLKLLVLWLLVFTAAFALIAWGFGFQNALSPQSPTMILNSMFEALIAIFLFFILVVFVIVINFYGPFRQYMLSPMKNWVMENFRCPACNGRIGECNYTTKLVYFFRG